MVNLDKLLADADAARDAGQLAEAERLYRQVLQAAPGHAQAMHELGFLSLQAGKRDEAVRWMQQSIAADPSAAEYHNNLAGVLSEMGQTNAASQHYRKAVAIQPGLWQAWFNLAGCLRQQGKTEEAIECYRQVTAIQPRFAQAHNELGGMLGFLARWPEAEASFRRAIAAQPDLVWAHGNLGTALLRLGRLPEAEAAYRQAIRIRTDYADAHINLGNLLVEMGRAPEAVQSQRRAIQLKPDSPEAYYSLGIALDALQQSDQAEAAYRKTIELRPDHADAWNNLATVLIRQWKLSDGIAALRRAIAIRPDFASAHSNLLLDMHYSPDYGQQEIYEEHLRWAAQHAAAPMRSIRPHANPRQPERRIRLGYLSPDFCLHSVGIFLEAVLANHDHQQFEVYCYSAVKQPDQKTVLFRTYADHWREIANLPDERVADMVREDRIDILVDLGGHTGGSRLRVLASKPAPIQATYLGYQDTSGLSTVDYRLTDAILDPPGTTERFHTEQLLRLPHAFACYTPPDRAPDLTPLPAAQHGHVTLASFGRMEKLTEPMLRLWSQVLQRVANSRLLLLVRGLEIDSVRRRVLAIFESEGIAADRVSLTGTCGFAEYLQRHNDVDVMLDTFPFNGHTLTCHALWMGVPTVTLVGQNYPSRMGLSILKNLALEELAADSPAQFVEIAQRLAQDVPRLTQLRADMRQRMSGSPMMNGPQFARDLEQLYRDMWRKWCA